MSNKFVGGSYIPEDPLTTSGTSSTEPASTSNEGIASYIPVSQDDGMTFTFKVPKGSIRQTYTVGDPLWTRIKEDWSEWGGGSVKEQEKENAVVFTKMVVQGHEIRVGDYVDEQVSPVDKRSMGHWGVIARPGTMAPYLGWGYQTETAMRGKDNETRWVEGVYFNIRRPGPASNEFGVVSP